MSDAKPICITISSCVNMSNSSEVHMESLNKLEGNNRFFIVIIIFFVILFFRYPRAVSHEWERVSSESLINLRQGDNHLQLVSSPSKSFVPLVKGTFSLSYELCAFFIRASLSRFSYGEMRIREKILPYSVFLYTESDDQILNNI